jgi:DNA-binding transcriptional LysR family regulator
VRLGRYHVGLCTAPSPATDLIEHPLVTEPMALVRAGLARRTDSGLPLLSIESSSATWRAVEPLLRRHHPELLAGPVVGVESFGAVVQMVKAGFGNGLVPLGVARESRLPRRSYRVLARVERRIALLTRKTIAELPSCRALREQLVIAAEGHLARV